MNKDELINLFAKIKKDKKTLMIIIVGFIGMFLVLASEIGAEKEVKNNNKVSEVNIFSEKELAEEAEKLIESIAGAGKTKIMITYESYEETVYAYDKDENINAQGERDFTSKYIILDGDEKEEGLKLKILLPEIKGVAVVCQGGENPIIKEQIISALSALFNISSNKISIAIMAK